MPACNILHTTTRCNLDCTYCYEKRNRDMPGFKHHDTTREEVETFLARTKEVEPDKQSVIVLFGGEPLMNMDIVKYAYEVAARYPQNSFHMSITTNGVKLKDKDFAEDLFALFKTYKHKMGSSLDLSYDFQGNDLRIYPDGGDSTLDVKKGIQNVHDYLSKNKDEFEFRIRCTIQHLNYDKIISNSIKTFEKYNTVARIIYTYAYNDMEEHFGLGFFDSYLAKHRDYLLELARMYNKRICFQSDLCEECGLCLCSTEKVKYRYQTPGSDQETLLEDGTAKAFNLFKNLVDAEDVEGHVKAKDIKTSIKTIKGIINE